MYLTIIFLPLIGSLVSGLFGRYLGGKGAAYITTGCIFISALFSLVIFFEIMLLNSNCSIKLFNWFDSGSLLVDWGFLFDPLTSTMLCVVLIVSTLVHLYSSEYMGSDPHLPRFMSYLSLFTFFMLLLITSDNFFQLFLGWEGVGLCSYLLISFWFTRLQANKSAIKAVIVNKIGDFAIAIAIFAIFSLFNSLDYAVVFASVPFFLDENYTFILELGPISYEIVLNKLTFISLMLFIGAVGKSAQMGLHTWLPDAMEGPTPVSALIHAATMVTAGVFVIIRCSPIFEYSLNSLVLITIVGALTAFFAATTGMLQNDLKKVIAYSTCSQLGYMVFSCGLSAYDLSLFHLANHAFFKALLFLSAGSVIHALANEQDMRRMGGLVTILPFTYVMILIGSLSLAGFPFLTGFYSKDIILEVAASTVTISGLFAYWLGLISAFFTAFYSFRLIYLTFYAKTNSHKHVIMGAHDAPLKMSIPLIILGFGSIFVGYFFKDLFIGMGAVTFSNSIYVNPFNLSFIESEFIPTSVKLLPFWFSCFGIFIALFLYNFCSFLLFWLKVYTRVGRFFFYFISKKWYFDAIYNYFITAKALFIGFYYTFKSLDRGLFELLGPTGMPKLIAEWSKKVSNLQTGYIYHCAFFMVLGLIGCILFWFLIVVNPGIPFKAPIMFIMMLSAIILL